MKNYLLLILLLLSQYTFSYTTLGLDSGNKEIKLYHNGKNSDKALLILGGIHGDEKDTPTIVNHLKEELSGDLSIYFIPSVNPTLCLESVARRGYLSEQLDSEGYVIPRSDLTKYNKDLYYRIFYGNDSSYINGKDHHIDPNRDFIHRVLPSTRLLIKLITELSKKHSELITVSIHGYMSGGRIYPEYSLISDNEYSVNSRAWTIAQIIGQGSGFIPEKMYSPAIPIISRFDGEFIVFTSTINNVLGVDIEIDGNNRENNAQRTLNGIEALLEHMLDEK